MRGDWAKVCTVLPGFDPKDAVSSGMFDSTVYSESTSIEMVK